MQWIDSQGDTIRRGFRTVRVVYNISRVSSKAISKLNPALVCIDTFISLVDLGTSYFKYRKTAEQTKQLQLQLEAYTIELLNFKAQCEEILQTEIFKLEKESELLEERLKLQRQAEELLKIIYEQAKQYLETIRDLILEHKTSSVSDDEIVDLEKKYHEALQARMQLTLFIIGG